MDSGVWIAAFNPKDIHHPEAKPILKSVASGELGRILLTDHVFCEIVTYLRRKMGAEQSIKAAKAILNSEHAEIIFIDEDIFNVSYHLFGRYQQLSFTDATSIAVMRNIGISEIFSFDSNFDGIRDINRLDTLP